MREGVIGRIRVVGIVVRGDQTEVSEADQWTVGPTWRYDTWPRSRKLWKRWGLIPATTMVVDGLEWCGAKGWHAGMEGWKAAGTDLSQPPILVYAMDGAQRERGIG